MADVAVSVQRTGKTNSAAAYTYTSVSAGDTIKIAGGYKDYQTLILVKNGSAALTLTVNAGNGLAGVNNLTLSVAASAYASINLDSARFMNVTGTDKGKIVIGADKACEIAVIEQGLTLQTNPNA